MEKLTGTLFGTSPSWNNNPDTTFDKAFDGIWTTFFDYSLADGGYTGIILNKPKVINTIRYVPRDRHGNRMVGGKFQGSNISETTGFVDLFTITTIPNFTWNIVQINDPTPYRYVRYLSPVGGYCNVAEIEFYSNTKHITELDYIGKERGTIFGTSPSWNNDPNTTFDKAFDGNPETYFDFINADGGYVGMDFGVSKSLDRIRFVPRIRLESRMLNGKFQGSNESQTTGYVDLFTITTTPIYGINEITVADKTPYRYVRYLSPINGHCNIAEFDIYINDSDISGSFNNRNIKVDKISKKSVDFITNNTGGDKYLTYKNNTDTLVLIDKVSVHEKFISGSVSTVSTTYVQTSTNLSFIVGTEIPAGDYLFEFSGSCRSNTTGSLMMIAFFRNGILESITERKIDGVSSNHQALTAFGCHTMSLLTGLMINDVIEIRYKTTTGSFILEYGTLTALKIR